MDPTYPLVPVMNFLVCILCLLPFAAGLSISRNVGVCAYAIWVSTMNLCFGINAILWSNNTDNKAPVWCMIFTRLQIGALIAVPACSLAITRRFYEVVRSQKRLAKAASRYGFYIDISLCIGLPTFVMILYYVAQRAPYSIYEELGCSTAMYESVLSLVLIDSWRVIPPFISAIIYSPRIVKYLMRQRKELHDDALSEPTTPINTIPYLRAFVLSCIDIFLMLPVGMFTLAADYGGKNLELWPGWEKIHSNWVPLYEPKSKWDKSFWVAFGVKADKFMYPCLGLIFFSIFGVTKQAMHRYRELMWVIPSMIGLKRAGSSIVSTVVFESNHVDSSSSC